MPVEKQQLSPLAGQALSLHPQARAFLSNSFEYQLIIGQQLNGPKRLSISLSPAI